MADDYRFAALSLTPAMFGELVLELAPGRVIRRNEAVDLVREFHESRGGAPTTTNLLMTAKKAFSTLVKQDLAQAAGAYGYYRLSGAAPESDEGSGDAIDAVDPDVEPPTYEYVYAYYLPTYREAAELRGETTWPHKIGMTATSVPERLRSQVGTALPERPVVTRTFACDDAALLERALHAVLELRGRKVRGIPGNEWFRTSDAEVDEIVAFVGWRDPTEVADPSRPVT